MRDLEQIRRLVGNITAEDLKHVDCAVCQEMGVFVPSTGFCQYAITKDHTHPGYMFNIFVSDRQNIIKRQISVGENQFLACGLSPDIPHCEKQEGDFNRYYAVMVDKDYFESVYRLCFGMETPKLIWEQFVTDLDMLFFIKQFIAEYENQPLHWEALLKDLAHIIVHKLVRSIQKREEGAGGGQLVLDDFAIEKTRQFMQENFSKRITVQKLAQTANLSVSHFERKFKTEVGCSPLQYLQQVRIEKAKVYLKQGEKRITDIAIQCGFSSASGFTYCFEKITGVKPSQYRSTFLLPEND